MARIALLTIPLILACGTKSTPVEPIEPPTAERSLADVGLDEAALDRSADPCNDFYQFACGGWLEATEMPADRSSFGRFTEIFDRGEAELHSILDGLTASATVSPELTKVRDFYGACMDEAAIEAAGAAPLAAVLAPIKGIRNRRSLAEVIGLLHNSGVPVVFALGAEADFKEATQTIAILDQGGLGLPDRDYYTSDEPRMVGLREAYTTHITNMFGLAGWGPKDAAAAAANVMAIETRLATASKTRVERRDIPTMYNKIDRAGIAGLAPRFEWAAYFASRGRKDLDGINVTAPNFVKQIGDEAGTTPLAAWRDYLAWHAIDAMADSLSTAFVNESFSMAQKISGQKEIRPRWKRCLSATNQALGELLAVPFLDRVFPGASKESAIAMVKQISEAFTGTLADIDWMSPATKTKAAEKRTQMAYLIGYPDKLKTYEFAVDKSTHAGNVLSAATWEERRTLGKIGKPTDRSEWYMLPQTVNAYYDPLTNQMAFPAGILQPPFFGVKASPSVNLGGMGMIVGHELTHGFDDQGAQFAGDGNMANWWEPADLEKFKAKSQCVVNQYATYQPLPGKPVNGELTLGENIADIGGVKLAYRAHRALLEGKAPTVAGGFSDDQQFFVAVGQAWCAKRTEERATELLVTDPHSPPKFRVNGALTNQPEFAKAFSCAAATPMNPTNRCEVW